jgi:hypothetical protein
MADKKPAVERIDAEAMPEDDLPQPADGMADADDELDADDEFDEPATGDRWWAL